MKNAVDEYIVEVADRAPRFEFDEFVTSANVLLCLFFFLGLVFLGDLKQQQHDLRRTTIVGKKGGWLQIVWLGSQLVHAQWK